MADPARFRPKAFPPPEFPPRRPAPFSRTPPAIFPVILGLLGLGLALRRGFEALSLPAAVPEALLGAVTGLWLFGLLAYGAKLIRRPAVLREDLRILPGRAGVAALSLGLFLVAVVLVPYAPGLARAVVFAALALHGALALLLIAVLRALPAEQRGVTPVWHLHFVGFILGALSAVPLGLNDLAAVLLWGTIPAALVIWGLSAVQLWQRVPPAPLRPVLAIHLAPASLFATVAGLLGLAQLALGFAAVGALILLALIVTSRWITAAGYSALWGAVTFPIAAYAAALFTLGWDASGAAVLLLALAVVPVIAWRVLTAWAKGDLAARTNAAQA